MSNNSRQELIINKNFFLALIAAICVLFLTTVSLSVYIGVSKKDKAPKVDETTTVEETTAAPLTDIYGSTVYTPPVSGTEVAPTAAAPVAGPQAGTYIVSTDSDNLNMRSGPSSDTNILTTIPKGSMVTVTVVNGNWGSISYGGYTGWVSMKYLTPYVVPASATAAATSAIITNPAQ